MTILRQKTGPAFPVVSDADAKAWLRVTSSAEDGLIAGLVEAATSYLDGADGVLGRVLVSRSWEMVTADFPDVIPLAPVTSITSIAYLDDDGATQTVAPENYRLIASDDHAVIELVDGASWPTPASRSDAVTVEFVAGYGDVNDVPPPICTAVKMLTGLWYENRLAATDKSFSELPFGVRALLQPYRVGRALI